MQNSEVTKKTSYIGRTSTQAVPVGCASRHGAGLCHGIEEMSFVLICCRVRSDVWCLDQHGV